MRKTSHRMLPDVRIKHPSSFKKRVVYGAFHCRFNSNNKKPALNSQTLSQLRRNGICIRAFSVIVSITILIEAGLSL